MSAVPAAASASIVKKVKTVRLTVPANKAKPSPQIGQALGQLGINMMKFCKEFNAMSVPYRDDIPLRVKLYAYSDSTYNFTVHPPATSYLILRAAGVEKGTSRAMHDYVGSIHCKQLYELARLKHKNDTNPYMREVSLEAIVRQMVGQCKSIGIKVDCSRTETPSHTSTSTSTTPSTTTSSASP
jgi:large subunit ribosomal protein L11